MQCDFEKKTKRVARVAHTCPECLSKVRPGGEYYKIAGSWDGEFYSDKICLECDVLRQAYFELGHLDSPDIGEPPTYERGSLIEGVAEFLNDPDLGVKMVLLGTSWRVVQRDRLVPELRRQIDITRRYLAGLQRRPTHRRIEIQERVRHDRASARMVRGMSDSAQQGPLEDPLAD